MSNLQNRSVNSADTEYVNAPDPDDFNESVYQEVM